MGEVYKARDTRLERDVAIKVLPEYVAADSELKQRFEREARTVAALNHPHICTLYDIGREGETDFLVLEYLDGETLAQRLEKGALPLDDALQIAINIADALDKAHRQGIVHRDLKPGNIMLTKAGAKLLDFGLAKLQTSGLVGAPLVSAAATQSAPLTGQGTILGTVQYMAPEQLEGKEADPRSDIFAFGAVLYEMVTGARAFRGESQASLIADIMHTAAPVPSATQPITPPALDAVVQTCLAKDPDERWHSAGDVKRQLRWIVGGSGSQSSVSVQAQAFRRPTNRRRTALQVGASAAAAALVGLAVWTLRPDPPRPVVRSTLNTAGSGRVWARIDGLHLALSPDGKTMVYSHVEGDDVGSAGSGLYYRTIDQLEPIPLELVGGRPFFSPTGDSLGLIGPAGLSTVSLAGGTPETVWEGSVTNPFSASWGTNDTIVFSGADPGLLRIPAGGGEAEPVTTVHTEEGETDHRYPEMLPGGEALLFSVWSAEGRDGAQIAVKDLVTGDRRWLLAGYFPKYAASGHIVFVRDTTLWAVPFDLDRLDLAGDPVPVIDSVNGIFTGVATFALADNGSLVYLPLETLGHGASGLVWVDRRGREEPVPGAPPFTAMSGVRISPDGRRVVGSVQDDAGQHHVVVHDLVRETPTVVTPESIGAYTAWAPDGERVVFMSNSQDSFDLFWQRADGTGQAEQLTSQGRGIIPTAFTSDGATLVLQGGRPGSPSTDVGLLAIDAGTIEWPLPEGAAEGDAALSPDGRWLAYSSASAGESLEWEIYVTPFPDVGSERHRISNETGLYPRWGPDGKELFYQPQQPRDGGTMTMMVVPVETEPTFSAGRPEVLFEGPYSPAWSILQLRPYDVAADGRFLMLKPVTTESQQPDLILVQNWLEELKRLVPVD